MHPTQAEPSFQLATSELSLEITARGGHLAPVIFHLAGRDVSPYALAPWAPEEFPEIPTLLSVLRGDFFCLPFGGQKNGPPHGDTANAQWSLAATDERSIHLTLDASDTGAHVRKKISTREGHHAIYSEHLISNLSGDFNYGNHPILDLSHLPKNAGRITTSPFRWASVFPGEFANHADGETQALAGGSTFTDLSEVRLASGETTDLTRYPTRVGNDDLVMMVNESSSDDQPFAWSAVVLNGYLWFSLKNPTDFPSTLLWISNGGRTAAPWLSRHIGRIGVEEVCSHFCHDLEVSRAQRLAGHGIATTRHFSPDETVSLRIVQAVALTPANFGAVRHIKPAGPSAVSIKGEFGHEIITAIDWTFIA